MTTCPIHGCPLKPLLTSYYCPRCEDAKSAEPAQPTLTHDGLPELTIDEILAWDPVDLRTKWEAHYGQVIGVDWKLATNRNETIIRIETHKPGRFAAHDAYLAVASAVVWNWPQVCNTIASLAYPAHTVRWAPVLAYLFQDWRSK